MRIVTMKRALRHCAEVRRRSGTGAMVRWVAYRSAQRLVDVTVAHVLWLDAANINDSLRPDTAYTFRLLSADEVRALAADPHNSLYPAMADRIVAGNDFCFAALAGPRVAAFGWFALGSIEPEHNGGTALSYPPDVACMYNGFTHPEFRGHRLHGLVKGLGLRALADRGASKLVSTVDWTNWASLRSNFRLGCVDLGRTGVLRLGRFRVGFYPPAARRLGIRFHNEAISRPASLRPAGGRPAAGCGASPAPSPRDCSPGPGAAPPACPLEWEESPQPSEAPPAAPAT